MGIGCARLLRRLGVTPDMLWVYDTQRIAEREGRPRRRYYELTSAGETALAKGASQVAQLAAELGTGAAGQTG